MQHVDILQNKVGDELLDLKHDQQGLEVFDSKPVFRQTLTNSTIKKPRQNLLTMTETPRARPQENPFINLLVNILLPVMVLNKGSHYVDPRIALAIALSFPILYGVQDYYRRRHKNYVSLIGIFNVMLTGSLVVMNLNGIWFAIKDASLPFVLGLLVLGSAWTKTPAARLLFCNPQFLDMTAIDHELNERGEALKFNELLKRTTIWLSLSFFISAVCNFFLAYHVFEAIDPNLEMHAQTLLLNAQIARMTWMGFAIIALPLMVFSGILVYLFLKGVSRMTGIALNNLVKT